MFINVKLFLLASFLFLSSSVAHAVPEFSAPTQLALFFQTESDGCEVCIREYGCDRENRSCENLCKSRLFNDEDDKSDCHKDCTASWASCQNSARSHCSYYCKSGS